MPSTPAGSPRCRTATATAPASPISTRPPTTCRVHQPRLWQVDTITDANDETTTVTYKPQQVAGHWVVDTITLPDGGEVSYSYGANGMLAGVVHADGDLDLRL